MVETESNGGNGNVVSSPADVRPALAQAAAASLDEIQQALLDAALGAAGEHWATVTYGDCGKKSRVQVQVPDVRARVSAIELLLARASAVPPRPRSRPSHSSPTASRRSGAMSWGDLQAVFALQFAERHREPSASREGRHCASALLPFSGIERLLLREALASVGSSGGCAPVARQCAPLHGGLGRF